MNKEGEENTFLYINGKIFICDCSANTFHKIKTNPKMYKCNSCESMYKGK
jgi:hypothetical protein